MRVAFDMDGVLADMQGALAREAKVLFGPVTDGAVRQDPELSADGEPQSPPPEPGRGEPQASEAAAGPTLTVRRQAQLWEHVQSVDRFWETLDELEPGTVARLWRLASERGWEVVFLTRRPECAGGTSQLQTQRWLRAKGFELPSVYVVQGLRGRLAAGLELDFFVDDLPENCADVAIESRAKAMLVWRSTTKPPPAGAKRVGVAIVRTVTEALDILEEIDGLSSQEPTFTDRVLRLLGLKHEPARV